MKGSWEPENIPIIYMSSINVYIGFELIVTTMVLNNESHVSAVSRLANWMSVVLSRCPLVTEITIGGAPTVKAGSLK